MQEAPANIPKSRPFTAEAPRRGERRAFFQACALREAQIVSEGVRNDFIK